LYDLLGDYRALFIFIKKILKAVKQCWRLEINGFGIRITRYGGTITSDNDKRHRGRSRRCQFL
jgi:hypothetical protein